MALDFDIVGDPRTLAEIMAEREQAVTDRALIRKKSIRYLIYAAVFGTGLVGFSFFVLRPILDDPGVEPTFVAVIAYFVPYLIFPAFIIGNKLFNKHCEKPRKMLDTTIAGLTEATPEERSEIGRAERDHPEVAVYLKKVAAQGRPLMRAEVDAIRNWVKGHELVE